MGNETKNSDGHTFKELYDAETKSAPREVKDGLNWKAHHPRSETPKGFRRNRSKKGPEWLVK